jgi:NAD(P)-dependent dehydrogenase (short-subunit alcohol dehydrogenase family)
MSEKETRTGSARPELPLAVVVSAGGIGSALARRLGQRNRLLVVDKDARALEQAVGSLAADGYDATGALCDITDPASVAALGKTVGAAGPMRILAHVAGLSPNMADWRSIMTVNLVGAARVAEALVERAGEGTAALFVSSLAGHVPPEPSAQVLAVLDAPLAPDFLDRLAAAEPSEVTSHRAYSLSKRGLNRMCRAKAAQWAERGGRINSLSPGPIASPMGAFENARSPIKAEMLKKMPLRREGTMLEVADAAEFLTSDRASYITGIDLLIDGGSMASWPADVSG